MHLNRLRFLCVTRAFLKGTRFREPCIKGFETERGARGCVGEAFLEKKVASLNVVIPLQTFLSLGDCSPVSAIWTRPGRKFFSRYPLSVKSGCMNQRHHFPSNRFNASGSKGLPMCSFMPAFRLSARSVFMALAVMAMIGRALKRSSFRINRVA